jgi:hypothetical protein
MFMTLLILWVLLALTILALFVWRKLVTRDEDDNLHVLGGDQQTGVQIAVAEKLELIDKWGKIFTIVAVVFGLILAVGYVYQSWIQNSHLGV